MDPGLRRDDGNSTILPVYPAILLPFNHTARGIPAHVGATD